MYVQCGATDALRVSGNRVPDGDALSLRTVWLWPLAAPIPPETLPSCRLVFWRAPRCAAACASEAGLFDSMSFAVAGMFLGRWLCFRLWLQQALCIVGDGCAGIDVIG